MDGYLGEIRLFSGTFAPEHWAFCDGLILPISQNQSLFAIVGRTYGGNNVDSFTLPDLRSRTTVGVGRSSGTSHYSLGEKIGAATVLLNEKQLPQHIHGVAEVPKATFSLLSYDDAGDTNSPKGTFVAIPDSGLPYNPNADEKMAEMPIEVTDSTIDCANAGSNAPHNNMQPYIAVNYIICIAGSFPSRN